MRRRARPGSSWWHLAGRERGELYIFPRLRDDPWDPGLQHFPNRVLTGSVTDVVHAPERTAWVWSIQTTFGECGAPGGKLWQG
jgi:hypothetical protein